MKKKRAISKKKRIKEKGNVRFGGGKETSKKTKKSEPDVLEKKKETMMKRYGVEYWSELFSKKKIPRRERIKQIEKGNIKKMPKIEDINKTAEEMIGDGDSKYEWMNGGKAQYRGRRSSVMITVPERVKKWGMYFFKLKKLGFKGAIETGNKRAKQLATKESIPIEDLRYMRNWYARHIYTSYPTFKKWNDAGRPKDKMWHNKRGIQAWISWGGNPGFNWVNSNKVINLLNHHFGTDYKKIKNVN